MAKAIIEDILSNFKSSSKSEWETKALKDLKGKALEDLSWDLNEQIKISPYYTASDLATLDNSILKESHPDWQIGEEYEVSDFKGCNKQLLEDLMHGLSAPAFSFNKIPNRQDLKVLFDGVGVEHIFCHFNSNDGELYLAWLNFLQERGVKAPTYFNLEAPVATLEKSVHIHASSYYKGTSSVHEELKNTLLVAKAMLLAAADPQLLARQIQFTFFVDNAYLLNIAKLRAFKLLWVKILEDMQLRTALPFIKVKFAPEAYGEDEQDNLIRATSMTMSAALGGANHIVVRPTSSTPRARRLARNIQLILKHESGFNQVADPAQGSFYVESLTNKLVNYCVPVV